MRFISVAMFREMEGWYICLILRQLCELGRKEIRLHFPSLLYASYELEVDACLKLKPVLNMNPNLETLAQGPPNYKKLQTPDFYSDDRAHFSKNYKLLLSLCY
uniref:Uncharacterized protein n=1 Tax=Cacopsylla melanoneura TaxID=428564 RepID=A0A8D9BEA1_9HEMI